MTRGTAAKVIWGGVIAALGVVLGLATAPLLVPVLEKLIFHDGSNADLAIASFFGGTGAGGWQGYLATTASTLEGFCLLALWCAVAIATLGAYVAWNEYSKKGRMVNLGTTGEGKDPLAPLKDYIRSNEIGPTHPAYAPAADFLSDGGVTTAGKNVLTMPMSDSMAALSHGEEIEPIEGRTPFSRMVLEGSSDTYCEP